MTELHRTSGTYTSFAHRLLWDSVNRHLALAEQHPADSWALHLSAGLLAAAAFEAYLNYVGGEILPTVWANEREFFTHGEYRGTEGKLRRIADEVGITLPDKAEPPYVGFSELQALRDKIVHARPQTVNHSQVHRADALPAFPRRWLELEAPPERVRARIEGLESLAVLLHRALQQPPYQRVIFGNHPFLGLLGLGSHSVDRCG